MLREERVLRMRFGTGMNTDHALTSRYHPHCSLRISALPLESMVSTRLRGSPLPLDSCRSSAALRRSAKCQ
jgi:hypothetical protein